MRAILITTDIVLMSFAKTVLEGAGIEATEADQYTSVIEGSVGVLPRRLMVADDTLPQARAALVAEGLGDNLVADEDDEPMDGGRGPATS